MAMRIITLAVALETETDDWYVHMEEAKKLADEINERVDVAFFNCGPVFPQNVSHYTLPEESRSKWGMD